MITLITGSTGSGKSYRAVLMMIDDLKNNKRVFSNIKLNIEDPNYVYIDEIDVKNFLSEISESFNGTNLEEAKINYMNSDYSNSNIYLDEVQFLGFRTYAKPVSDWLTLHRHFNQNVFLITQIIKNLSPVYQDLVHKHIEYRSPTNRVISSHFQYSEFDSVKGEKIKTSIQKPDSRIFEVYKTGMAEGGTHPLILKLFFSVVGLVLVVSFFIFSDMSVFNMVTNGLPSSYSEQVLKENKEKYINPNKINKPLIIEEQNSTDLNKTLHCEMVRYNNLKKCSSKYVWCEKSDSTYIEVRLECEDE